MGVKGLNELIKNKLPNSIKLYKNLNQFKFKTFSIDSNLFSTKFYFISQSNQSSQTNFNQSPLNETNLNRYTHLGLWYKFLNNLKLNQIKPILIFDGLTRLPQKKKENEKRLNSRLKVQSRLELEQVRSNRLIQLNQLWNHPEEDLVFNKTGIGLAFRSQLLQNSLNLPPILLPSPISDQDNVPSDHSQTSQVRIPTSSTPPIPSPIPSPSSPPPPPSSNNIKYIFLAFAVILSSTTLFLLLSSPTIFCQMEDESRTRSFEDSSPSIDLLPTLATIPTPPPPPISPPPPVLSSSSSISPTDGNTISTPVILTLSSLVVLVTSFYFLRLRRQKRIKIPTYSITPSSQSLHPPVSSAPITVTTTTTVVSSEMTRPNPYIDIISEQVLEIQKEQQEEQVVELDQVEELPYTPLDSVSDPEPSTTFVNQMMEQSNEETQEMEQVSESFKSINLEELPYAVVYPLPTAVSDSESSTTFVDSMMEQSNQVQEVEKELEPTETVDFESPSSISPPPPLPIPLSSADSHILSQLLTHHNDFISTTLEESNFYSPRQKEIQTLEGHFYDSIGKRTKIVQSLSSEEVLESVINFEEKEQEEEEEEVLEIEIESILEKSQSLKTSYSKRAFGVPSRVHLEAFELAQLLGIPCIQPSPSQPHEAEGLCSTLYHSGLSDFVVSEDSDVILYGAPLLRKITTRRTKGSSDWFFEVDKEYLEKQEEEEVDEGRVLERGEKLEGMNVVNPIEVMKGLEMTKEEFIDFGLLCGTDFTERIPGCGPANALKLMREYKSIETILSSQTKFQPLNSSDYLTTITEAREIFLNLPSLPDDCDLELKKVDKKKLRKALKSWGIQIEEVDAFGLGEDDDDENDEDEGNEGEEWYEEDRDEEVEYPGEEDLDKYLEEGSDDKREGKWL